MPGTPASTPSRPQPQSTESSRSHFGRGSVADVVHRNIRAQSAERRQRDEEAGAFHAAIRALVTMMGSLWFLSANALFFTTWILLNTHVLPLRHAFDPFPFPLLSTITGLESIWLTTCVLINQKRTSELQERRSDLGLHVNLLAEHEITRILTMLEAISTRVGVEGVSATDLPQLTRDTEPQAVMEEIERQTQDAKKPPPQPTGL
jgi:uncharacterized membrane protein